MLNNLEEMYHDMRLCCTDCDRNTPSVNLAEYAQAIYTAFTQRSLVLSIGPDLSRRTLHPRQTLTGPP